MNEDFKNNSSKPGWNTVYGKFYPYIKDDREKLKQKMTPTEIILWEQLRNKKLGVKFRRQHIIDCYIPDFVSLSIKLIIEVDGKIHLKRRTEDEERTRRLEMLGYKVIRFKNEEVENDLEKVLNEIRANIEKSLTSPSLFKGEE